MLAVADTALDLLVLELVLHALRVRVLALVLGLLAPVRAGLEDDVLADGRGIRHRSGRVRGAQAEFRPRLALGDAGVDDLLVGDEADSPRRLDLQAILVEAVLDDRCCSVLILHLLDGWELDRRLVEVLVVGPVVPSILVSFTAHQNVSRACGGGRKKIWPGHKISQASFDMIRTSRELPYLLSGYVYRDQKNKSGVGFVRLSSTLENGLCGGGVRFLSIIAFLVFRAWCGASFDSPCSP